MAPERARGRSLMAIPQAVRPDDRCLRAAFEESPVEAVILDATGAIVAANRAWRDFGAARGGRADGEVGRNYLEACPGDEAAARATRAGLMRILDGDIDRFEQAYVCPDADQQRWFLLDARACSFDDACVVLVCHFDITRRFLAEHRADHDPVTGLLTRRAFAERLRRALARSERSGMPSTGGAVIFVALDDIAHLAGPPDADATDTVLQAAAERLRHELRSVDAVARIGEKEFVLLAEETAAGNARGLAQRLRARIEQPVAGTRAGGTPQCSIGISHFPQDGATAARLILAADRVRGEARGGDGPPIGSTRG